MSSLHETQANDYGNRIDADTHFHDDDRHLEDDELDAMDQAWVREQQRRDDEADAAEADVRMAALDVTETAERFTSAIVASGAVAAVDAIAALFERRVS
jgi:hypothetical protein